MNRNKLTCNDEVSVCQHLKWHCCKQFQQVYNIQNKYRENLLYFHTYRGVKKEMLRKYMYNKAITT